MGENSRRKTDSTMKEADEPYEIAYPSKPTRPWQWTISHTFLSLALHLCRSSKRPILWQQLWSKLDYIPFVITAHTTVVLHIWDNFPPICSSAPFYSGFYKLLLFDVCFCFMLFFFNSLLLFGLSKWFYTHKDLKLKIVVYWNSQEIN